MTRTLIGCVLIAVALGIQCVSAQELKVGHRVMPKTGVSATIDGQEADFNTVGWPATITDVSNDTVQIGRVTLNIAGVVLLEEAEDYYSQIIAANDRNVGWAYGFRGITRESQDDYDGAIQDHSEDIRLSPDSPYPYYNRAKVWMRKHDSDRAILDYSKSIELGPELVLPHICRAMIWQTRKDYASARRDLDDAIRIDPLYAGGYLSRAVLLSCCPDAHQ